MFSFYLNASMIFSRNVALVYERIISRFGTWLSVTVALAAFAATRWKLYGGRRLLVALILILGVQMSSLPNVTGSDLWKVYLKDYGRDYYARVMEGLLHLRQVHMKSSPKGWVKEHDDLFETIALPRSTRGCSYMGDFSNYVDGALQPGDLVVIVDKKPDIVACANESLRKHGIMVKPLGSKKGISKYGVSYDVVACEVRAATNPNPTQAESAGSRTM